MKPLNASAVSRIAVVLIASVLTYGTSALASTAANTTITNQASVAYNDAGGNAQTPVTAQVSVTVSLVPSAPVVSSPANQTVSQGSTVSLSYTITATANGPDTYNLTSSVVAGNMSSVTGTLTPSSVVLGATTLAAATTASDASITVPYDNDVGGAASINGIGVGSVIVIGSNAVTVASITKSAGTNTATLTFNAGQTVGAVVAAGSVIGERKTFSESFPTGTVSAGNTTGTQTVTTTGTSTTTPNPAGAQTTPTVITVQKASLTVTKTVSTDGGATFVASANAVPGTTLTYRIVVTNAGATVANSVTISDAVPSYLSYVNGTGKSASAPAAVYSGGTGLTEGSGGYAYSTSGGISTVTFSPTDGSQNIAAGSSLVLFFQAKIN